jgi:putative protease
MKPELLLPAGDLEKLKIAFQYGADAVYAGVPVFSLRARENDFTINSVKEAVDYAKSIGKKIYLTVNIFPHNYKIPALLKALRPLADLKPDAFIVADPGVIMLCKEIAPEIPLHLSVQANTVNWASAQFWHKQGVERIILSREISLKEIREIHEKNPGLELEFFVHGSICIAYSGRCLLSNYFTHRDANQGTCVQSCRWKYKLHHDTKGAANAGRAAMPPGDFYLEEAAERPGELMAIDEDEHGTYIMNSKDMCLIENLKQLKEAGICSFKVEGRNKTLYYAATIAKTYRRAIDDMEAGKPFDPGLLQEVMKTSNRGYIPDIPQEEAQDYQSTGSKQTCEFVGIIKNIHEKDHKNLYEFEVKGRLETGDICEVMTPTDRFDVTLKQFQTLDGEVLQTVHPGQAKNVLIELPKEVPIGTILRKEKA